MKRILVTGSREWSEWGVIEAALRKAFLSFPIGAGNVTVVHGAAEGADSMASLLAGRMGFKVEPYPAKDFPSPRARNQHMVDLGADVCLSFALKWASGTGMCARMARKAGIPVIDYGVDTSMEARP